MDKSLCLIPGDALRVCQPYSPRVPIPHQSLFPLPAYLPRLSAVRRGRKVQIRCESSSVVAVRWTRLPLVCGWVWGETNSKRVISQAVPALGSSHDIPDCLKRTSPPAPILCANSDDLYHSTLYGSLRQSKTSQELFT